MKNLFPYKIMITVNIKPIIISHEVSPVLSLGSNFGL
jgi:hypothetical protein